MNFKSDVPIYLQIVQKIKVDLVIGHLLPGEKLRSTRELAVDLKVNPNTIQKVYRTLELEGICETKRGMGTYVTSDQKTLNQLMHDVADGYVRDFMQNMKALNYTKHQIVEKIKSYKGGNEHVNDDSMYEHS